MTALVFIMLVFHCSSVMFRFVCSTCVYVLLVIHSVKNDYSCPSRCLPSILFDDSTSAEVDALICTDRLFFVQPFFVTLLKCLTWTKTRAPTDQ